MHIAKMGLLATVILGLGSLGLLAKQAGTGKKSDQERILGVWRVLKAQADGNDAFGSADILPVVRIEFSKDGKMQIGAQGMPEKLDSIGFKLPGAGQIDMDGKAQGIFKFEGDDKLTICFAFGPDANRPAQFNGDQGSKQFLLVLERAKPNEKMSAEEKAALEKATQKLKAVAQGTASMNNLSQLARAMHLYYDQFKRFPFHAIYSKDGKTPLLSWRVELLPFVDANPLYMEFKRDEPWDSPHNKTLIARMPKIYEPLGAGTKEKGMTYYQVFTGPGTVFDGTQPRKLPGGFPDGASQTLLIVEAKEPVIWTKPADLVLPKEKDKMPGVGGLFPDITHAAMCDASVMAFATSKLTPAALRAIVTPAGGELIDLEKLWK